MINETCIVGDSIASTYYTHNFIFVRLICLYKARVKDFCLGWPKIYNLIRPLRQKNGYSNYEFQGGDLIANIVFQ